MDYSFFLDGQIQVQQRNIRSVWMRVVSLLGLGIIITAICYIVKAEALSTVPDAIKLGPNLITAAVSAFSAKDISVSRERLTTYECLKANLAQDQTPEEKEQLLKTINDILKETAKR